MTQALNLILSLRTSVGSLNALLLAQGNGGLEELRNIWFGLRRNEHMWLYEDWWKEVHPELSKRIMAMINGKHQATSDSLVPNIISGSVGGFSGLAFFGPYGLLAGAVAGSFIPDVALDAISGHAISDFIRILDTKAKALINLNPVRNLMGIHFKQERLDAWVATGKQLRLAMVGLKSGEICYVTETGDLISKKSPDNPFANGLSLIDGTMASSSIATVFPPVNFAGDSWIDGGHRENIPLEEAIRLGATRIFVISAGPIDQWSTVNNTKKGFSPPKHVEEFNILEIAERTFLEITPDEIASGDVFPLLNRAGIEIKLIAPTFPTHELTTIDPDLIRINYNYGYRVATDILNNASPELRNASDRIAIKQGEIALRRNKAWKSVGVPFDLEISTLLDETNIELTKRTNTVNVGTHATSPIPFGNQLLPGDKLLPNQSIVSEDGRFRLTYQRDMHLVVYDTNNTPIWATGKYLPEGLEEENAGFCIMQCDGNLVIYDSQIQPFWASNTAWGLDINGSYSDDLNDHNHPYPGSGLTLNLDGTITNKRT